ncbi:MAG: hypothetical protein HW388_1250 [Dehalococcoidia bacterium]|nr:hypothetical protein [Dehalococcoidia bacterium]
MRMSKKGVLASVATLLLLLVVSLAAVGCAGDEGAQGLKGDKGDAGATGAQGPQGIAGLTGDPGEPGPLPPGYPRELDVTLAVSAPANGTHLVVGERATVTVTLKDQLGRALTPADFATLGLYMYGPQETTKTVTAVKLLNATADRAATPHHYIDLLKSADVQVSGNIVTYVLQAVSDEEPGTYTATVRAVLKADALQQTMELADFQLGTATAEAQIVEKEKCAACHLGAASDQFYFAHVDVGRSPVGNPSLDSWPVRTCKACHNNDGYAAYRGDVNDPSAATTVRTPDTIVRRVHGVHFGEELKNPFNNTPETGNFAEYLGVVFPKDILNCTGCHVDDRWKTQPSREACTACHDDIWFGAAAAMPETFEAHPGGPQANDAACALCHTSADSGNLAIPVVHDASVNVDYDDVVLSMSAPGNGKFYVEGEKPVVTIVIKDANGNPIDHTTVLTANFAAANLYVQGPRARSVPVLTTASKTTNAAVKAAASNYTLASGTPAGWTFAAGDTFKIAVNGGAAQELAAPVGLQTPDEVVTWLKGALSGVTVAKNTAGTAVTITSTVAGNASRLEIYNSPVTTKMGWKQLGLDITEHGVVVGKTSGVTMEPLVVIANSASSVSTNLRVTTDTAITRTAANITYQLDDVAGLEAGTYMAFVYANPVNLKSAIGVQRSGFGIVSFQIGTETVEKKVAGNCTQCHGDTIMHLNVGAIHPAAFDPDQCKSCHDYGRSGIGEGYLRVGGTSTSGWAGYGTKPIVARVHGVHRGAYLEHPEEVYAGNPRMADEIIFPQDIRNCTVCHDATTSGTWATEPSRLACLSCHDSDEAKAHARLQTMILTPADPYGSDAAETCKVCHGAGKEFSPDKVHNIWDPYAPPYPRAAE